MPGCHLKSRKGRPRSNRKSLSFGEAAKKQGDIVIGEYRDDGFSGDLLVRPALDRLRDDAAKGFLDAY